MPRVVWLFSMARSGSSVAAYAAAAPWGHAVADEVLGPWDRTGGLYKYPAEQRELRDAYLAARCRLTPDVVERAERLFAMLDTGTGVVVSKHPHTLPTPAEFHAAFPAHRAVWLLRNPLHRLNSLYARAWHGSIRHNHDLDHFKEFAHSWLEVPRENRLLYDDLKHDPQAFFTAIFNAWGLSSTPADVRAAADYARRNYHEASRGLAPGLSPDRVLSESKLALPAGAAEAYLHDPFVADLMRRSGWPVNPEAYGAAQP